MRVFAGWSEFHAEMGNHLGYSLWHEVSQATIDDFAHVTQDHQWIHVDPERAASGPFGSTIAHGFLTLSLIPMLMNEIYRVDGLTMAMNYGLNKVRFPAPLRSGRKIRAAAEFVDSTPVGLGNLVTLRFTIESDDETKPVCVAESLALMAG